MHVCVREREGRRSRLPLRTVTNSPIQHHAKRDNEQQTHAVTKHYTYACKHAAAYRNGLGKHTRMEKPR
jgi:hypothetical protein